jgi:LPXTG-site transpeptidase (sortase) family protein
VKNNKSIMRNNHKLISVLLLIFLLPTIILTYHPTTTTASSTSKTTTKPKTYPAKRNPTVKGIMQLEIPKININVSVLKGVGDEQKQLKVAPSLLEGSPLPDEWFANVVIGAHRSTYGAIFRYIDALKKGDEIYLTYDKVKYTYIVEKTFVTDPKDTDNTGQYSYSCLSLYACHPVGSSKYRYVVRAKMKD